jgi:hypothetical protein
MRGVARRSRVGDLDADGVAEGAYDDRHGPWTPLVLEPGGAGMQDRVGDQLGSQQFDLEDRRVVLSEQIAQPVPCRPDPAGLGRNGDRPEDGSGRHVSALGVALGIIASGSYVPIRPPAESRSGVIAFVLTCEMGIHRVSRTVYAQIGKARAAHLHKASSRNLRRCADDGR